MDCPHLQEGLSVCGIASSLAGFPCELSRGACETCMRQPTPQAPNHATASLALYRTRQRDGDEVFFELRKRLEHLLISFTGVPANPHCECPMAGYCSRHQKNKDDREFRNCKGLTQSADCGRKYWVAWESGNLGATAPENPILDPDWVCSDSTITNDQLAKRSRITNPVGKSKANQKPADRCRVGTRIKKLIEDKYGLKSAPGCKCNRRAKEIDLMGCQECKNNVDLISSWLTEGAAERVWIRPIVAIFGGTVKSRAKELVLEAIALEEAEHPPPAPPQYRVRARVKESNVPDPRKTTWAYGITTTVSRLDSLLVQTINSLSAAGFDEPWLFIDGLEDPDRLTEIVAGGKQLSSYNHVIRNPTIKTFGNWILGLWELYIRFPVSSYYAMFQDDFVTCANLKSFLTNSRYPADGPERGYWNLYTFPQNEALSNGKKGWYLSNQKGLGAVGLVFNRDCVQDLLSSRDSIVERPTVVGRRSWSNIDGGIVTALGKRGWKEYVHNPSLIQHTGLRSSMGGKVHPTAPSFPGEQFDARQLLS